MVFLGISRLLVHLRLDTVRHAVKSMEDDIVGRLGMQLAIGIEGHKEGISEGAGVLHEGIMLCLGVAEAVIEVTEEAGLRRRRGLIRLGQIGQVLGHGEAPFLVKIVVTRCKYDAIAFS